MEVILKKWSSKTKKTSQATTDIYLFTMEHVRRRDTYALIAQNPFSGDIDLPENYAQAISGPYANQWKCTLQSEVKSLRQRQVFDFVKRL